MTESIDTPGLKVLTRAARDPSTSSESLERCVGLGPTVDRLLARHPNAPAQLLEELSHSSDRATRKAVVLNPSTPKEALLRLAPQFPGDFFKNPAFDWLLVEHPNLMFEIGGGVLKNLLKRSECPSSFMVWAAVNGSELERLAVAMNRSATPDVLQAIERRGGKAARAAQLHSNHPLAGDDVDLESAFRQAVERAISECCRANSIPSLAQWPALSLMERLDSYLEVCIAFATSRLAPVQQAEAILNELARDSNQGVRWMVSCNRSVPGHLLQGLAGDSDLEIQAAITENPGAPVDARAQVLHKLCEHSDVEIRCLVARNEVAPQDLLLKLADSGNFQVRRAVASNPSAPTHLLHEMAADSNQGIRAAVAANTAATETIQATLASDKSSDVRLRVAGNLVTPNWVLEKLAADASETVQCAVARIASAPKAVLADLAIHKSKYVRRAVSSNPAASLDTRLRIVLELASDNDLEMRCFLSENPITPIDLLTKFVRAGSKTALRRSVASNAQVPDELLNRLSRDRNLGVRLAVARNTSTSIPVLQKLAFNDRYWSVRHAASLNLAVNPRASAVLISEACQESHRAIFDYRNSSHWRRLVAGGASKDPRLSQACLAGDLFFLPDHLAKRACRKVNLAWRILGLSHRLAEPADLAKRSRSVEWIERMAIARNVNTPANIIEVLRKDPHRLVARQAAVTAAAKSAAADGRA